jgi:hypothetical protein
VRRRPLVLWGTLLLTLALSWWAVVTDEDPLPAGGGRMPPRTTEAASVSAAARAATDALRGRRESWPAWAAGLFLPMSFAPPPVPTSPVVQQSSAPPLPFRYVGTIEEVGKRAVILLEGDRMHIVSARERVGDQYRVERVSATEIEFTYLPLMQRQSLVTSHHDQYR